MADGGRYRRRRYGAWTGGRDGAIARKAHQPHFQAIDYNPLNGGVARWFEPIDATIGAGPSMTMILGFCRTLFSRLAPATASWEIEVHQFRIEARKGEDGRPTPEGLHRDGVDYVLVLLVNRRNIASGMTSIHALDGRELGHFTLTHPFDAALVDDTKVAHGVTPVEPLDARQPAYRDVLVVTFRKSYPANLGPAIPRTLFALALGPRPPALLSLMHRQWLSFGPRRRMAAGALTIPL